MCFFLGDVLMSARLILIGLFALIDRLRRRKVPPGEYEPRVAVLIPAYNEEKVIVRTIRSVLNSDYANLRVIVIDDGSIGPTPLMWRARRIRAEIAAGKLTVLTKPNAGKAEALNFGLQHVDEEIYVGIDADTVIAPDAVSKLVCHFADARVGAVAGNAKVGNRVNLWTRWQALEYITSQNFERRALDLFNVVTVVPGAIGAWRTAAVHTGGNYPINTVAEDADLTMNLLEQGYKVIYEDRALAFTEAPVECARPDAAAVPLVVRNAAGGLQAQAGVPNQPRDGTLRAAEYFHLPDSAAAGVAVHRPDVCRRGHSLLRSTSTFIRRRRARRASKSCSSTSWPSWSSISSLRRWPFRWSGGIRPTKAMAGCSSISGCSVCLSPGLFHRALQDDQARDRWAAL